ncbi:hypothetical protein E2I00_000713 [Balaenoptera physalus]|uniref:Uncharacterized protein n=1 Tax=Balaenoptera physalus TaxID=9770 RepID=A0A6A1QE17_BALPH|nr:hypothetical protein E2I00_000713 [Balaenoptera physalus]
MADTCTLEPYYPQNSYASDWTMETVDAQPREASLAASGARTGGLARRKGSEEFREGAAGVHRLNVGARRAGSPKIRCHGDACDITQIRTARPFLLDSVMVTVGTKWTCHSEDQRLSPPTPLLSEAGSPDFTSTFCLRPLFLVAPGLQFLDLYDADSEDLPGHSSCSFNNCSLGSVNCDVPLHTLKSTSPGEVSLEDPLSANIPVLVLTAASWAPASPEASSLEVQGRTARLPGPLEDLGMAEEDWGPHDVGRHQGRARASWPPPRLGTERDRGPKLSLSKRKLELLLAEPEKNKRKKQYVA